MTEWTDEQRRVLVECAVHTTELVGHELHDCLFELRRLVKEYRENKVDDYGRAK